jgi:HEAT repeat protein
MDAPEAVPSILPCLTSSNPNVIRDACRTLAVLGNKDVIASIEPLLKHSRADVRKDAQDAIDLLQARP